MERTLRALVSTRTTQLPPTIAMRAREVATPSPADLAAAERDLVIVRRYYVPPAPFSTGKKPDQGQGRSADQHGGGTDARRSGRRPAPG